jgi:hypothetical protein
MIGYRSALPPAANSINRQARTVMASVFFVLAQQGYAQNCSLPLCPCATARGLLPNPALIVASKKGGLAFHIACRLGAKRCISRDL